jgi:hypothetical protein
MGPFPGLRKRHCPPLGYEDSTDILRDNLYLLLNRDKMVKLLMIRTISLWPEPNAPTERTSIL